MKISWNEILINFQLILRKIWYLSP